MRSNPNVALSVVDLDNPQRMAAIQATVVQIRDHVCRYMDRIAVKYTSRPFPARRPDRVCFVIAAHHAGARTLDWLEHRPG